MSIMATKILVTPKTRTVSVTPKAPSDKPTVDVRRSNPSEPVPVTVVPVKKAKRSVRTRPFDEQFTTIQDQFATACKMMQTLKSSLKSLEKAYNRDVSHTKTRVTSARTPTIVFDQVLVDYFTSRLDAEDLIVTRKDGLKENKTDLSGLNTETRVHRTDVTQLYNKVFIKHDMRDQADKRHILYSKDAQLVELLTTGNYDEEKESDVQEIRNGTYRLTIFNIQRFTNQHLSKVALPDKAAVAAAAAAAAETTPVVVTPTLVSA